MNFKVGDIFELGDNFYTITITDISDGFVHYWLSCVDGESRPSKLKIDDFTDFALELPKLDAESFTLDEID